MLALELKLSVPWPRPAAPLSLHVLLTNPAEGKHVLVHRLPPSSFPSWSSFFLFVFLELPSRPVYNKVFRALSPLGSPQPVDSARLVPFERLFLYHCFSFRYDLHSLDGILYMNASYRLNEAVSLHTRFPSSSGRFAWVVFFILTSSDYLLFVLILPLFFLCLWCHLFFHPTMLGRSGCSLPSGFHCVFIFKSHLV